MKIETGFKTSFDFEIDPATSEEFHDLFFGIPARRDPAALTHSVILERQMVILPDAPVKGHPLVGKRYRMARRKYVRLMRRGARRGFPTETVRQYIPAVHITVEPSKETA